MGGMTDQPTAPAAPTAEQFAQADLHETLLGCQAELGYWKQRAVHLAAEVRRQRALLEAEAASETE